MGRRARTALVHLVRSSNGVAPFERFLSSYSRCSAELDHDLVLLFKGFGGAGALAPYLDLAADARPATVEVSDAGFDLTAYLAAAATLGHDRVCFVNSFSEILVPGWLRMLDAALEDPGVGAAGASGSWASHFSYNIFQLGLPGEYSRAFPGRRAAREAMHGLSGAAPPGAARHWIYAMCQAAAHARGAGRFPMAHLRTNVFLIDRSRLLALEMPAARTKWDTYRLESGPRSMTARLRAAGTPPVVVDAGGVARQPEEWHRGNVFFQAEQQDLIVADNQTRSYTAANAAQRIVLSAFAWGLHARPGA